MIQHDIRQNIKDLIKSYPLSYKKELKLRYKDFFESLSSSSLPFKEELYLYITNTSLKNYLCKGCGNKCRFWTITRGYMSYCSIQCRNKNYYNSFIENTDLDDEIPDKNLLLQRIGTKYSSIPNLLKKNYPKFINHLNKEFRNGSITEKLYRWTFNPNTLCKNCQKNQVRFLDFRRGFQKFCGNKCMSTDVEIKNKKENTLLIKTGFKYPMQYGLSKKKQKISAFSSKKFIFPSGKVVYVQGFEGKVITELLKAGIKESELIVEDDEMPVIFYKIDDTYHRYYPDIYIPRYNLILEIKSNYTFNGYESGNTGKYINFLKRDACIKLGYNFRFIIR